MAGEIRVDTEMVSQIATSIESLNKQLTQALTDGKTAIDNLGNTWDGEASEETIASFDQFAANYFQNYEDILTQYVSFLRTNVSQGYFETEAANTALADAFK
ncbi:MAG: WXG100 family type VII secretion target [Clostridia bacterium]